MVSPTKILSQKRKLRPISPNPNNRNKKRFEVTKSQYMARKGNAREMAKKNIEISRQLEMKKLKNEVEKMTVSDARRLLSRAIRQAKMSA